MKRQLLLVAAAVCAASATAQLDLNRTVVIVNGEEIKGPEYYRRMEFLPNVGMKIGNSFAEAAPGFLTLDQLINERLLLQLAKEKGVSPSDAEIQSQIKLMLVQNPQLLDAYAAMGATRSDLEYEVRLIIARFKLETRGVTVTDLEIEKHYKDNPSLFTIPKTVELRVITVSSEADKALTDADLKAGKAFDQVARDRSVDISKANGGRISARPVESLDPEARAAVEKIKVGQMSEWVTTKGLFTKILFEKANPSRMVPLDDSVRFNIRRNLMIARGRVKPENDFNKMLVNMRAKSTIDIKDKQFADTFKRMKGMPATGG